MTKSVSLTDARVALVGNPNSGKTALFNALTGGRQKVANYAGVTVERKEGALITPSGRRVMILDLPGTYSLRARSPDEEITRDVVLGRLPGEAKPDLFICVADASNLRLVLRLALELKQTRQPMILALNMIDIAERQGLAIDIEALSRELGVPVTTTVAVRKRGIDALVALIDQVEANTDAVHGDVDWRPPTAKDIRDAHREAERILKLTVRPPARPDTWTGKLDNVLLHPVWGVLILLAILFLMFQAVFSWATPDHGPDLRRIRLAVGRGQSAPAARRAAEPDLRRPDFRRRQRDRVPAADHDPVFLHHPAGGLRLHGPRGLSDGPRDGRRRIARPRLHSPCCPASPAPFRESWPPG